MVKTLSGRPNSESSFPCNCCSTTLVPSLNDQSCCSDITGRAKEAEWRKNHCQGAQGLPWSSNGGTAVATVISQWTLLVGQRRHNGCTRKAEASLKSIHNVHNSTPLFTGRPMADHRASILRPRRCVCLPPASFERPVSDRPPRRPLCDCFEHAQNFTATVASMAMSERSVYHPWTTKTTVLPPFCLQRRPGQLCGRTREAQRSQPLCLLRQTIYRFISCMPFRGLERRKNDKKNCLRPIASPLFFAVGSSIAVLWRHTKRIVTSCWPIVLRMFLRTGRSWSCAFSHRRQVDHHWLIIWSDSRFFTGKRLMWENTTIVTLVQSVIR